MGVLRQFIGNYYINVAFLAWISAQFLKTLFTLIATKKFVPERLVGAGGMPSSHSALVCSLTVAFARKLGFDSSVFALSLALAGIVMYDAMGVRRAAGEQAKVLNKIVFGFKSWNWSGDEDNDDEKTAEIVDDIPDKALKEFIGHTPLEVLGGALLGILIAISFPV
ncbi:divergent PAP2 family protein [Hydrogenoanaerobacterium sp.]|uniref:divergent PAP2 family protein n=1 Tax=Hydrogenoanaerobacterium sp. TaxID=2953763 RepID=UPI002899ED52|nr:divergent PAP2 family protein [Hydrogenoanaerobacterium sp.]